jgi:hypothetical protein
MKQRRFTSSDFVPEGETGDEDAVLDASDPIHEMKALAGLQTPNWKTYEGSNISNTANEKAQLMRDNNIKPGTDEWFKLWFSRPYLTGEPPV